MCGLHIFIGPPLVILGLLTNLPGTKNKYISKINKHRPKMNQYMPKTNKYMPEINKCRAKKNSRLTMLNFF